MKLALLITFLISCHAFALDCNEPAPALDGRDSTQLTYFQELYARGLSAPIEDYLKLWYPERDRGTGADAYFLACLEKRWGTFAAENGSPTPACVPDVLYSWGSLAKASSLARQLPDGDAWSTALQGVGRYDKLWLTVSPAASYTYGTTQVRMKLKPTAHPVRSWRGDEAHDFSVPGGGMLNDFSFSDPAIIESWSFGTPEQYDEIVKDIRRISSGELAIGYVAGEPHSTGLERLYNVSISEARPANEASLKMSLYTTLGVILSGRGQIHYAKGTCRNRANAFETHKPTYFGF